jgi:hypothetical protein
MEGIKQGPHGGLFKPKTKEAVKWLKMEKS